MIAREPDRLHDRLGAGHVERHLVEAGNLLEPAHVRGDHRMVGAEHRAERARLLLGRRDAVLVEVVAEDVDAVGAGEVVEHVAVEIGDGDAGGGLQERAGPQMLADDAAELERHAVALGELQIGDSVGHLGGPANRRGVARPVKLGEPGEGGAAARRDLFRRMVGAEETVLVVLVERNERGDRAATCGHVPTSERCFACESSRRVLSLASETRQRGGAERIQRVRRRERIH